MKNRFRNILVPLALIFGFQFIEQFFATGCGIRYHTFNKTQVKILYECEKQCPEGMVYASEKALCISKFKSIHWTATIVSGICTDGECRETNESEIYKQELSYPIYDVRNPTELKRWPFECRFTNIQDQNNMVFLSTQCSLYCNKKVVKLRKNGTPCIFTLSFTNQDYVIITSGVCQNGECVDTKCGTKVNVHRELVLNRFEESYEDYKKREP
uniref:Putative secreted protein n=1 Tax=Ixodes ricinus TaxID=34613 RepID=A0A0K8RG77_IXORI